MVYCWLSAEESCCVLLTHSYVALSLVCVWGLYQQMKMIYDL